MQRHGLTSDLGFARMFTSGIFELYGCFNCFLPDYAIFMDGYTSIN